VKHRPIDFQALVRDYGWDVAERACEQWLNDYDRRIEELRESWRRVFRGTEGARD
jgi:hypothetical protein